MVIRRQCGDAKRDFELCFHHMKMMEQGGFFFSFSFLWSVSSASCSLRAFELSAVISPGTTGKTLLHCVSLIEAAVPKNNRTRTESKLMNS